MAGEFVVGEMVEERHSARVVGVVVTFHPDLSLLGAQMDALVPQVDSVVIVDNGSSTDVAGWNSLRSVAASEVISLPENLGVAAAQNAGIEWAGRRGAQYVLLMDQDSEPAPDMVARLLIVAESKVAAGVAVAAVGPRYVDDRHNNPPPFIRVRGVRVERMPCPCGETIAEVDYLIASGCLISMVALDRVGAMREELFIDYVDIEWGLRAKAHGFQSFGACGAMMRHALGDEPISLMGRRYPARSPLRHYYMFRNAIWMYRRRWLPLHWKLADGCRLVLKYAFYTLLAKPRHRHWWMMSLGAWHGVLGRMGRF